VNDAAREHFRIAKGFPLKTSQPLRILRELLWQHLDGDFTAQVGVFSTVHLAHATLADLFDDFVVGECFAEHENPLDAVGLNVTPRRRGRQFKSRGGEIDWLGVRSPRSIVGDETETTIFKFFEIYDRGGSR